MLVYSAKCLYSQRTGRNGRIKTSAWREAGPSKQLEKHRPSGAQFFFIFLRRKTEAERDFAPEAGSQARGSR